MLSPEIPLMDQVIDVFRHGGPLHVHGDGAWRGSGRGVCQDGGAQRNGVDYVCDATTNASTNPIEENSTSQNNPPDRR
jgi:hypothetical protein